MGMAGGSRRRAPDGRGKSLLREDAESGGDPLSSGMTDSEVEPSTLPPAAPGRARWTDWMRLAIPFAALVVLILWARARGYFEIDEAEEVAAIAGSIRRTPWLAATLVALYAGLAAMALPVAPLGYGAGALFGFLRGVALVWVASLAGASAGYVLARGIMRGPALRLLGRRAGIIHALRERHGFMTVLRIQLLPLVAFGPFNYAAGIAGIPFLPFLGATAIGIIPGTLAIVYVGDRVMAGLRGEEGHPFLIAGLVATGLVALSFIPAIVRWQRKRRGDRRTADLSF